MDFFIPILAVIAALATTAIMGLWLIPWLHKLKFGQTILDIGPKWHKNKQGTPTMGGFLFITGTFVALAVAYLTAGLHGNNRFWDELFGLGQVDQLKMVRLIMYWSTS